jgi:hypothetical protein
MSKRIGLVTPLDFETCSWKCRCGPDELPVLPVKPIGSPRITRVPTLLSSTLPGMCMYEVAVPSWCSIVMKLPHAPSGQVSCPQQFCSFPSAFAATTPPRAARIGVKGSAGTSKANCWLHPQQCVQPHEPQHAQLPCETDQKPPCSGNR